MFCNDSPCHHLLFTGTVQLSCQYITMSPLDGTPRESYRPVHYNRNTSLSSTTNLLSIITHQSDTSETPISCVRTLCQRLIAYPGSKPVILVCRCWRYSQLSSELLTSPKRSVVAPVPTTVARHRNHHKASLEKRPSIIRPKVQQPYSRACILKPLPPLIQSGRQNPTFPEKAI